jgi:hypothetical protein
VASFSHGNSEREHQKHLDQCVELTPQIFSNQDFRFLSASNNLCFHLLVEDTKFKPDILEPIEDTMEVELGKLAMSAPLGLIVQV